jgi:drug/metabolite transporter (DMT)-like permease
VREVDLPGVQVAFWRILLASIVYWLIVVAAGRKLTLAQVRASAPAGIAISVEIALFFVAIKATTVANATIIAALMPIIILFFGIRRFGEHISGGVVGLTAAAFAGVGLVVFGSTAQPVWSPRGDLLALAATVLFAAYYVLAKRARQTVPAIEFQTAVWLVGAVVLFPLAVFDAGGLILPTVDNWAGIVLLLLIPGTGHFLMNWAHARVPLTVTSLLTLGLPVLSTIGAALVLDEPILGWQIPGIAIVMAALIAVVRQEAKMRAAHSSAPV